MENDILDIDVTIEDEICFDVEIFGSIGEADHALLNHLDFDSSGHVGFQRSIIYIAPYHAYEIRDN